MECIRIHDEFRIDILGDGAGLGRGLLVKIAGATDQTGNIFPAQGGLVTFWVARVHTTEIFLF